MKRILIFCAIVFASHAIAKSTVDLIEEALLHDQRAGFELKYDYGLDILIEKGVLEDNPFISVDYKNYYLPIKPIEFLDTQLIAYDQESYANGSTGFGCCPNDGLTLVLLPHKDKYNINIFAKDNNCIIESADFDPDIVQKFQKKLDVTILKKLITLSCKVKS